MQIIEAEVIDNSKVTGMTMNMTPKQDETGGLLERRRLR